MCFLQTRADSPSSKRPSKEKDPESRGLEAGGLGGSGQKGKLWKTQKGEKAFY